MYVYLHTQQNIYIYIYTKIKHLFRVSDTMNNHPEMQATLTQIKFVINSSDHASCETISTRNIIISKLYMNRINVLQEAYKQ